MSCDHRITKDDLAELQSQLSDLFSEMMFHMTPRQKVRQRKVQKILSDVQWHYGPPITCEKVEPDDSGTEQEQQDEGPEE